MLSEVHRVEGGSQDFYQNPGVQVFGQNFKWDLLFWVLFHVSSREGGLCHTLLTSIPLPECLYDRYCFEKA
jgi:hypothetical protein